MSYTQADTQKMLTEIANAWNEQFASFRGKIDNRLEGQDKDYDELKKQMDAIETAIALGQFPGGSSRRDGVSLSAAAKEHKEAFLAWVRKGVNPEGLRDLEVRADLSTLSDPNAGYLVYEEMEKSIERLATDAVAMRRLAAVVKAKGEYKKPLSVGGAGGGWVTEKGDRDETDTPELKMFAPAMAEAYALPEVTQKLLDMSDFDVSGWLLEEVNDVLVELEGEAFITGNGVGRPKGIIDSSLMVANASWEYGKTGYIAGGHASLLNNADKLFTLQHALKPVYRRNSTWLMNDNTFEVIRKFKDGEGNYIWRPGLSENAPDMLLGKPVEIDDNMPDIGAGKYPIAYGDFKRAYRIIDHVNGIRLLRDPYTKKGWVKFYVTKRVTGGISNYQAIKFMKIAAS